MDILVLHGPNLNLMGNYSAHNMTLSKINTTLRKQARSLGHKIFIYHFIEEGKFVRQIQRHRKNIDAIIFTPGALSQNCHIIFEVFSIIKKPLIEVHIKDCPGSNNNFTNSLLADISSYRIFDFAERAYHQALQKIHEMNQSN
ncbi:MAG TPA: type II 3-dehydroquinate dehydratase [bacterium]|nr:type II 3-dehydroquinate dehydratase [bacterium]